MPHPIRPERPGTSTGRDATIDVARGLGIILVVFGHLQRGFLDLKVTPHAELMQAADFILYTTHMPLFFMLAGRNASASLRKQAPRTYLATRPRAILWPYAVWSVLFVLVQQIASTTIAVHHAAPPTALLLAPLVPIGIFWFLQSLFCAQCVAALSLGHSGLLLALTLAADLAVTLAGSSGAIPGLTPTLLHLPFFALGFLAAEHEFRAPPWLVDGFLVVPAACGTAGLGLIAFASGAARPVDLWTLPISSLGIATVMIAARVLARHTGGARLSAVGRLSMPIYVLHIFTLPLFMRAFHVVPPGFEAVALLAGTAFGIAASLVIYAGLVKIGLDGVLGLTGRRPGARRREPLPIGPADWTEKSNQPQEPGTERIAIATLAR